MNIKIRQISVFVENKAGRLYDVMNLLGENGINVRSLSLADTSEFGIIRMIVDDPGKAKELLKSNLFSVGINDVVGIAVPDRAGGLASLLSVFAKNNINVEYMYAFVRRTATDAVMVFRFSDTDTALEVLKNKDITILKESELLAL